MTYTKDNIVFEPFPSNANFIDLTHRSFERLLVLGYAGSFEGRTKWWCECRCGKITKVQGKHLRRSHTKSCGCQRILEGANRATHGETRNGAATPEFRAFCGARNRCQNSTNADTFANYGGRGIKFLYKSFEQFLAELGRKPAREYTVERIDNNGHYEPGNVKWGTRNEQAQNKRNNRMLEFNGVRQPLPTWAQQIGLSQKTLKSRINLGWCVDCAITKPLHGLCPHR